MERIPTQLIQIKNEQFGAKTIGVWNEIQVQLNRINNLETISRLHKNTHNNIARIFGVTELSGKSFSVSEFTSKGFLSDILHDFQIEIPWNPLRMQLISNIGKGLCFLHQLKIIHGDLTSSNIIIDDNWIAKISSIGFPKITRSSAPELFTISNPVFTTKSDIYSFGMLIWEISSRKIPFSNVNEEEIFEFISSGKRETIPIECPKEVADLINLCWNLKSEDRPDLAHINEIISRLLISYLHKISQSVCFKEEEEEYLMPAKSIYNQGKLLWDIGRNGDAFPYFREAAKLGNLNAYLRLDSNVEKMTKRKFFRKKIEEGFEWFKRQARSEDPHALYNLALCYEKEYVKAFNSKNIACELYLKAGSKGYGRGWYAAGKVFSDLNQHDKAMFYLEKGAESGVCLALTSIGYNYKTGKGVAVNQKLGMEYYLRAAEKGEMIAQYNLGRTYQLGILVPKDMEKAKFYLEKVAVTNDPDACYHLALIYIESSNPVERSKVKKLLKTAANRGSSEAQEFIDINNIDEL